MRLFLICTLSILSVLTLSGCTNYRNEAIEANRHNQVPDWCEHDTMPTARQIYECEKMFKKQDEADRENHHRT